MENSTKKNNIYISICFLVYMAIVCFQHLRLGTTLVSDDAARMAAGFGNQPFWNMVVSYWNHNGRATLDALSEYLVLRYSLWKVLNILCYLVVGLCFCFILQAKRWQQVGLILLLILLIPFKYFSSAGYVSTSVNYWFTTACVLFVMVEFNLLLDKSKYKWPAFILFLIGNSYIMFHDQYMAVTLLVEIMAIVYMIVVRKEKKYGLKDFSFAFILLFISVVAFLTGFLSPGHLNRMGLDPYWFPSYVDWTFGIKVYEGFTSTVAVIIYRFEILFDILCFCITILGFLSKGWIKKIVGLIPSLCMAFIFVIGRKRFIYSGEYMYNMPDLNPYASPMIRVVGFVISVIIVIGVFVALFVLLDNKRDKFWSIGLLFVGAVSREMMGFSATIFMSSYRTFIPMLLCIIPIIYVVICETVQKIELKKDNDERKENVSRIA